jgi:hypothetical protein
MGSCNYAEERLDEIPEKTPSNDAVQRDPSRSTRAMDEFDVGFSRYICIG